MAGAERLPAMIIKKRQLKNDNQKTYQEKADKGRRVMAHFDPVDLPRGNPCAQCGKPITKPDWVEQDAGRTFYLWRCRACDYRFEAIAIYPEPHSEQAPLAA